MPPPLPPALDLEDLAKRERKREKWRERELAAGREIERRFNIPGYKQAYMTANHRHKELIPELEKLKELKARKTGPISQALYFTLRHMNLLMDLEPQLFESFAL